MPAVSQKQYKFMQAVKGGYIHKPGLSPQKAAEYVEGVHPSKLPEHTSKFHKLRKMLQKRT